MTPIHYIDNINHISLLIISTLIHYITITCIYIYIYIIIYIYISWTIVHLVDSSRLANELGQHLVPKQVLLASKSLVANHPKWMDDPKNWLMNQAKTCCILMIGQKVCAQCVCGNIASICYLVVSLWKFQPTNTSIVCILRWMAKETCGWNLFFA